MNGLNWTAQVLLAGFFLTSGMIKLFGFTPLLQAVQDRAHIAAVAVTPIRSKLIGFIEVLLGFGVLLPDMYTTDGIVPEFIITRLCAAGLAVLMTAVASYHMRRKEPAALDVAVFLLAIFVIVGRWPAV